MGFHLLAHFGRALCFLLCLCAFSAAWVHQARPDWVHRVDAWFCERHTQEHTAFWKDWQAANVGSGDHPTPEEVSTGAIDSLDSHLRSMEPMQFGDRLFPIWKDIVVRLVKELRSSDRLDEAVEWQSLLAQRNPQWRLQEITLARVLIERGRPEDLDLALERMRLMRLKFPDWPTPAKIELQILESRQDDPGVVSLMRYLIPLDNSGLDKGWQRFAWASGDVKPSASQYLRTEFFQEDGGTSHASETEKTSSPTREFPGIEPGPGNSANGANLPWAETRILRLDFPEAKTLKSLRVDPPAFSRGWLLGLECSGITSSGEPLSIGIERVGNCEYDRQKGSIALIGHIDPKIVLHLPSVPLRSVQLRFVRRAGLPAWVAAKASKTPLLAGDLAAFGLWPEPK